MRERRGAEATAWGRAPGTMSVRYRPQSYSRYRGAWRPPGCPAPRPALFRDSHSRVTRSRGRHITGSHRCSPRGLRSAGSGGTGEAVAEVDSIGVAPSPATFEADIRLPELGLLPSLNEKTAPGPRTTRRCHHFVQRRYRHRAGLPRPYRHPALPVRPASRSGSGCARR